MISGLSRPAVIWRSRAGPAIVGPETLWLQVAALLPARQDTHPPGCHRPRIPDRIVFRQGHCRCWCSVAATAGSPTPSARRPRCAAAAMSRSPWPGRAAAPAGAGRLPAAVRFGAGAIGRRRLYHQGALRRPGGRAQPTDCRRQGLKRSLAIEATGIPLAVRAPPANRHRRRAAGRHPGRGRSATQRPMVQQRPGSLTWPPAGTGGACRRHRLPTWRGPSSRQCARSHRPALHGCC
jgi:hypothetical protein